MQIDANIIGLIKVNIFNAHVSNIKQPKKHIIHCKSAGRITDITSKLRHIAEEQS